MRILLLQDEDGKFRQTSIASDARKNDNKEVESDVDMISLPHPSNGDSTKFIIYNNRLLELQHMHREDSIHSWFVNQNVVEDGRVYVATNMDPLFIVLPLLRQHGANFSPLSQLMVSWQSNYEFCMKLLKIKNLDLELVCDVTKFDEDMILVRHNNEKVLKFLSDKLDKLKLHFEEMLRKKAKTVVFAAGFMSLSGGSSSNSSSGETGGTMNESTSSSIEEEKALKQIAMLKAFDVIADYLDQDTYKDWVEHLGIGELLISENSKAKGGKKRAWEEANPVDAMKEFTHGGGNRNIESSTDKKASKSAPLKRSKSNKKVNTKGMKSMSSFFSKKPSSVKSKK